MKNIRNPWIKLRENITPEDYELINELQTQCIEADHIAMKLELDYKVNIEEAKHLPLNSLPINEFLYFDGQELIGYLGIGNFGGADTPIEVMGMVKPECRRKGVFTSLIGLARDEWKKRDSKSVLLLCDRKAESGQQFIRKIGGEYRFSEYEMFLGAEAMNLVDRPTGGILLAKATNKYKTEIARQNAIYFRKEDHSTAGLSEDNKPDNHLTEEGMILPEEEEKRGMIIYLAIKEKKIIGKVNVQLISGIGGIYGLGVLPEYRGKGYGREIFVMAIEKLLKAKASEIMLQVAAGNENALKLYKSCGFVETSTMDYFEINAPLEEK